MARIFCAAFQKRLRGWFWYKTDFWKKFILLLLISLSTVAKFTFLVLFLHNFNKSCVINLEITKIVKNLLLLILHSIVTKVTRLFLFRNIHLQFCQNKIACLLLRLHSMSTKFRVPAHDVTYNCDKLFFPSSNYAEFWTGLLPATIFSPFDLYRASHSR